ncbi:MAG TPA: topoisomerase DNA-binding C4 zinc finger domain-containing protein [bacterium]|nr:topoisomerase DNA-binding C4 zinc finger domain-containing protein [bacterium]
MPDCPQCGKSMRRRKSAKGDFWGCSALPECKGTRPA